MPRQLNVYGEPLAECCSQPRTGFYRSGSCEYRAPRTSARMSSARA